jgi:hypothetical protein
MTLPHRHHFDNLNDCPLFAWASEQESRHHHPFDWPVRVFGRRHGPPLHRAALVCHLAGIGGAE